MASEFHVIFGKQNYRKPIKPRSFVNRSSFVFFTSNSYVMKRILFWNLKAAKLFAITYAY